MNVKVQDILKYCLGGIAILYPVLIFFSIVIFNIPVNNLSGFIIVFSVLYLFVNLTNVQRRKLPSAFISPVILFLIGITGSILDSNAILEMYPDLAGKAKSIIKLYPLFVNAAWFFVFGLSLLFPPTFVFEIVTFIDKSVKESKIEKPVILWCYKATIAWCVFFIVDTVIAWFTIFGPFVSWNNEKDGSGKISDTIWGIYNGAVTYIAMAVIFIIQFALAKRLIRKLKTESTPLS
ncbi:MAG: hypothetical protein LBD07_02075 [Spirochaetaceae bacterium]|jgi:uncharacterized membrane protein|nr:hypothetical protein [Spirochaetaceae bacterium]